MNQISIDFDAARAQRDAGMLRAARHAEQARDGWSDEAYTALTRYAEQHGEFTSEDFRAACELRAPTTPKAWGPVFLRAARAGIIEKIGFGIAKQRHLSPCPLWRSKVLSN